MHLSMALSQLAVPATSWPLLVNDAAHCKVWLDATTNLEVQTILHVLSVLVVQGTHLNLVDLCHL